jgi:hypothetical protein
MTKLLSDPTHLTVQVLYRRDEADIPHNKELEDILQRVWTDYPDFYHYVAYDCTRDLELCPEIETDVEFEEEMSSYQDSHAFPKVTMHIPQGLNCFNGKPLVSTSGFQSHANERLIRLNLEENMPFLGEVLDNDEDAEDFEEHELNRVILFWTSEEIPRWYKALSSQYKGRLSFGFVGAKHKLSQFKKHDTVERPILLGLRKRKEFKHEGEFDYKDGEKFVERLAHETVEKVVFRKPAKHDEDKFYFAEVNKAPTYDKKWKLFKEK